MARDQSKQKKGQTQADLKYRLLWNDEMSFAASEAYNLLRANLLLSFADGGENGGRVIGVTSTEHAEGKSLTSINLAASLAKANHKTLLLECDLRLPVVAKYLNLDVSAGISELLTGYVMVGDVITTGYQYKNLDVATCGRTPPNPSELLSSKRMGVLMQFLRQKYEYIVVDLPPVSAVSDAIVMSPLLDGMLVVVRHNVTTQPVLADVVRQLQYANVRILGFVYNGADPSARGYGRKYYKYDYYGYGNGYSRSNGK